MRKLFLALVMGALAPLVFAISPAFAAQHSTPNTCDSNGGVGPPPWFDPYQITGCVQYQWHDQVDGTGVAMTNITIGLTHGCPGDTDADPVGSMVLRSYRHDGTLLDTHTMDDMLDCQTTRDLNGKLQTNDIGKTMVYFDSTVRVNNAGNLEFFNWCTIRPDAADTCETHLVDQ